MRKWMFLAIIALVPILSGCEGCDKKKKYVAPPPAPSAPSNLIATPVSSTEVHLSWKDNSTNEKGFYVYRKTTGNYDKIGIFDANTTSCRHINCTPQTTYWYKVTAYNDGGESNSSNEVSATTPAEVPDAEILNYHMEEEYLDFLEEWRTDIIGDVRNNTGGTLTIKVKGKFYNYSDVVVDVYWDTLRDVPGGETWRFEIPYWGERIKRVEAWVDDYY